LNFSGAPQTIALDAGDYTDYETRESVGREIALEQNGVRILSRPSRYQQ